MGKAEEMRARFGTAVRPPAPQTVVRPTPEQLVAVLPAYRTDLEAGIIPLVDVHADLEQPRKDFDLAALTDLAGSLKQYGQLQPALVRQSSDRRRWLLIDGERRWRALKIAGLLTLRALFIRRDMTAGEVRAQQLVSNLLRVDLKPIEQAYAFQLQRKAYAWTQQQLAEHLHVSQAHVSRVESLLNLPAEIQTQTDAGAIPVVLAYDLARVENVTVQKDIADLAIAGRIEEARERVEAERPAPKSRNPSQNAKPQPLVLTAANGVRVTFSGGDLSYESLWETWGSIGEQLKQRRGAAG